MKKKIWIPIVAVTVLLAALFVPIPRKAYDDGGTREYVALTYKIVDWNRLQLDGGYEKTRIYFGSDRNKSIDELWEAEFATIEHSLIATVLEVNENSVLVEPVEGEEERLSSDQISFGIGNLDRIDVKIGSIVQVPYTGGIMESYPAQLHATGWKLADTLRGMEYTEQWLDKTTAEKYDNNVFDHITITRIYANCFFATTVIPSPYEIKLNGSLSENWCVGDQIICTYENTYYDREKNRMEVDMLTVEASNWQPDPNACYKPVIYLYPEQETEVSVELLLDGKLTCTYPAYNAGWKVTASPDGSLTDTAGQTYNYLYWEGETRAQYDLSKGFCVKGEDTAAFDVSTLCTVHEVRHGKVGFEVQCAAQWDVQRAVVSNRGGFCRMEPSVFHVNRAVASDFRVAQPEVFPGSIERESVRTKRKGRLAVTRPDKSKVVAEFRRRVTFKRERNGLLRFCVYFIAVVSECRAVFQNNVRGNILYSVHVERRTGHDADLMGGVVSDM